MIRHPQLLFASKRKKFIKSVVDQNVELNNFLITLGTQVKDDIWLDKIEVDASGFTGESWWNRT